MKRYGSIILTLILTLSVFASLFVAAAAAPETPAILIPAKASEAESGAAELLRGYLEQITGQAPEIISGRGGEEQVEVIAITLRGDLKNKKKGSYILRAGKDTDGSLLPEDPYFRIDAGSERGLWNGVYGFLSRFYGVEIFSADVKKIPESEYTELPDVFYYKYDPLLEYADTDWISPHDLEFALANGLNGSYSPLEAVHGGKVNYIWFCHSLSTGIVPASELFETHPEYFALTARAGEREPTQLCLSNPEAAERAKKDVLDKLEKSYDPSAALNIVSVTQNDNQDYCVCENCSALARQYGGQSGLMLWFVNQIAEVVEKDYPDVVVDTFAYQYTRGAPEGIVPRGNVCVRMCSIECCFAHTLNDSGCEINRAFMKDLEDWSAVCSRLYIWDYVTNFAQTLGIFPNFAVLRENIKTFREHNVAGIYEEGAYYADSCNAEFADLRAFLLARFMRDELTAEEEAELIREFLENYYCEGADEIGEFISFTEKHAGNSDGHLGIYYSMEDSLHGVTKEDIAYVDGLWETAVKKTEAAGNTAAAERIKRSQLCWRYYKSCTGKGEFSSVIPGLPDLTETEKLRNDLAAFGVTRFNEGSTMDDITANPDSAPALWNRTTVLVCRTAVYCAAAIVLLSLFSAVVALVKKHPVAAVLMPLLAASAAVTGAWASVLFIQWDRLPLYALIDALMLLTVAAFCFIALWAKNGCAFPKGKKLAAGIIVCLSVAAAPYEIIVLLVNTIILHSVRPTIAITISAFCQIIVITAALLTTNVYLFRKERVPGTQATEESNDTALRPPEERAE